MTDLGRSSPGSPRSGYKRDRDHVRERRSSPNRYERRSPRTRDKSPPRKKRRDERRESRKESPERKRYSDRSRGRLSESPRRERGSSRSFGGRDLQRYDPPLQTFHQFMDAQDDRPSTSVALKRYEEYKHEYDKRNSRQFFKQHQEEAWFREKYYPTILAEQFSKNAAAARNAAALFLEDLKSGRVIFPNWDADESLKSSDQSDNGKRLEKGEVSMDIENKNLNAESLKTIEEEKIKEIQVDNSHERVEEKGGNVSDKDPKSKTPFKPRNEMTFEPPADSKTVFISLIPPTCSTETLLAILNKVESGQVIRLLMSDPKPLKQFVRVGWATYSSEEAYKEALNKINGVAVTSDFTISVQPHVPRYTLVTPRITPAIASTPARIKKDLEQIRKLTRILDEIQGIEKNVLLGNLNDKSKKNTDDVNTDQVILSDEENGDQIVDIQLLSLQDKITQISERELLDLFVWYLGRVHWFCYYTCHSYPNYDYLLVQGVARRGTKLKSSSEDGNIWSKDLDNKIKHKISNEAKSRKELMGEIVTEKCMEELYRDKIYKDNEDRFRCEMCTKMFKAVKFVKKHIDTKHLDVVNSKKQKAIEEQFYTNYVSDPKRILPSSQYLSKRDMKELFRQTDKSPKRGSDILDRSRDPERDRRSRSPRERSSRSPIGRSPRYRSPRERSPRNRSSRDRSSRSPRYRERSPRERSPWTKSPRDRNSRSPRERSRSPRDKLSREHSPHERNSWDRSPRERSRDKSPRSDRSPRRRMNWSGGRNSRQRRMDRTFRGGFGARPRIEYVGRDQTDTLPTDFRDKMDPRSSWSPIVYVDLDRPPEDSFEIDYEKALAAFAAGEK